MRFRKAIIDFTATIKSAPWDTDFASEAELIFQRDVAPTVLDIEQEVNSNNALRVLLKQVVEKPIVSGTGVITAVISQFADLSALISHSLLNAGAISTTTLASSKIIYDTIEARRQSREKIEANQLYFYYRAQKKLT